MSLQIANAICHMHSKDILHGDIKPANVLVQSTGFVKLSDLCCAVQLKGEHKYFKTKGDRIYTSHYRPIEALMAGVNEAGGVDG